MVPRHDNRMNIGAKGLSGEGYKGHCFWDTEIFILPYYSFTDPEAAKKLEEYRYLTLPGAHAKAKANGYSGVYDGASHSASATPSVTEGTKIEYSTDGGQTWSETAPSDSAGARPTSTTH